MVKMPGHLKLGLDRANIKEVDAVRQELTVKELLRRLFDDNRDCFHTQMLADEVGMGKTFVSMGVAYSLLVDMRTNPSDFPGQRRKVVVLTPRNEALFEKWNSEVGNFVLRCIEGKGNAEEAAGWFKPKPVWYLDQLVYELGRTGPSASIIVAKYSVFGSRFIEPDKKQQLLVAALFRWWRAGFTVPERTRFVNAGEALWNSPASLEEVDALLDQEGERDETDRWMPNWAQFQSAFSRLEEELKAIKEDLDLVSHTRSVDDRQAEIDRLGIKGKLNMLYRKVLVNTLVDAVPLVIVDEAHNWKNHANGYRYFRELLGPHTRRLLLLTATPFQLSPDEMLDVMEVQDCLAVDNKSVENYHELFGRLGREDNGEGLVGRSLRSSEKFVSAWQGLGASFTQEQIMLAWRNRALSVPEDKRLAEFIAAAHELKEANAEVSNLLRKFVIRHRRDTHHRLYLVGREFQKGKLLRPRSDSHIMHYERGIGFGEDSLQIELAQYALMRAVAAAKKKGRTALGTSLTGSFSILFESSESEYLASSDSEARFYVDVLRSVIRGSGNRVPDHNHPKLKTAVNLAASSWERGEKVLVYCFRPFNANLLRDALRERVEHVLEKWENELFGDETKSAQFRKRLSDKTDRLAQISFDRVLYTYHQFLHREFLGFSEKVFRKTAEFIIRAEPNFDRNNPDRLLVLRASETALASELLNEPVWESDDVVHEIAQGSWIEEPYGTYPEDLELEGFTQRQSEIADETIKSEESRTGLFTRYKLRATSNEQEVDDVFKWLSTSTIIEQLFTGPNLWGPLPQGDANNEISSSLIHQLWVLTKPTSDARADWRIRLALVALMRKAFLRRSYLLRALASNPAAKGHTPEELVKRFYAPLGDTEESLAIRFLTYLKEISDRREHGAQQDLLLASLSIKSPVTVVHGTTGNEDRTRYFRGFNSPLLPEILVCTSVGQEGIDLHRFCRRVIHYDLPFNPATLEQRTGRIDRIGSKTFRDMENPLNAGRAFLEVGIPYLAATYDEKVFNDMRRRAQKFEILTGGDLASDVTMDEKSQNDPGQETSNDNLALLDLPEDLLAQLRTNLALVQPTPPLQ